MTIKEDLSKYPCYLFSFGTLRPMPKPQDWSYALQCHHFVPKSYKKTNPKFYERVEHLQKLIFMASQTHYNLHAMCEDTFYKKYGIEKHKLLFNRKKWREGHMNQLTTSEQAIYDLLVNDGMRTRDIALKLGYTSRTIETKINTICQKKGVATQKKLIVKHYKEIISRGTLCPSVNAL